MITADQAREFCAHMARAHKATVIRKEAAIEMQMLATGFDIAKRFGAQLPDRQDFLERYATTIGGWIYMPSSFSPAVQLEVMTHECQHVNQFYRGGLGLPGGPGMWWLYLVEPEARARYEAEALTAGFEVMFACTKQLPDLDAVVAPMEGGYMLGPDHLALIRGLLETNMTSIVAGTPVTEAAANAIGWLRGNAPELLAP